MSVNKAAVASVKAALKNRIRLTKRTAFGKDVNRTDTIYI